MADCGGNAAIAGAGWESRSKYQQYVAATADFAGRWSTVWGNGSSATPMTLKQNGNQVFGQYRSQGGRLTGIVTGKVLQGSWVQNDGAQGTFKFTLSPDGNTFSGRWRNGNSGLWSPDAWNGVRY